MNSMRVAIESCVAETPSSKARRGRGRRAGLTRARVVEAARELDPDKVTMQAVAQHLGVDRGSVHHHVSDVQTLRELVAHDAFTTELSPVVIPDGADWREACRLLAVSMYDAVIASEGFGVYIRLTSADIAVLEPVEQTLRIMLAAGFDEATAARALATLATLAGATAREHLLQQRAAGHPQFPEFQQALADAPTADLPLLRHLAESAPLIYDETQLGIAIDLLLDGLACRRKR